MSSPSPTSPHARLRSDLGAYVLGALEPAERERLERHLADCSDCREELARLAVLPGLLRPLRDEPPEWRTLDVPPVEPLLARIRSERRRARWTLRGAAAAAVIAGGLLLARGLPATDPAEGTEFVAAGEQASAVIQSRPWGSAVAFSGALRDTDGFVLVAVARDGHRAQVASWSGVDHPITLEGSCYLEPDEIRQLEVRVAGGDDVVAVLQPE